MIFYIFISIIKYNTIYSTIKKSTIKKSTIKKSIVSLVNK